MEITVMPKTKQGKFGGLNANSIIYGVVGIVLAFEIFKVGLPYIRDASANISTLSGLPFTGFFASNGLVLLIVMAAILLGVVSYVGLSKR